MSVFHLANDLMRTSAQRLSLSFLPTLITRFMERRHILEASSSLPWRRTPSICIL